MSDTPMPAACFPARRISAWARAGAGVLGYDVFLSYSRNDGLIFALELEEILTSRGLLVFRDESGLSGGEHLVKELGGKVRKCRLLVVIVTLAAARSTWVDEEV